MKCLRESSRLLPRSPVQESDGLLPAQSILHNQEQVERVWGGKVDSAQVDFELDNGASFGVDQLIQKLSETMPIVAEIMDDLEHADQEKKNFVMLKKEILWHAGIAGASDAVPVTGTVTVPAIMKQATDSIREK